MDVDKRYLKQKINTKEWVHLTLLLGMHRMAMYRMMKRSKLKLKRFMKK